MSLGLSFDSDKLAIEFPRILRDDFVQVWNPVNEATEAVLLSISPSKDFSLLAKNSPALLNNNWKNYLSCSMARILHIVACLKRLGCNSDCKVLDFGSYFGNLALACAKSGITIDAMDKYGDYGNVFAENIAMMKKDGVNVIDLSIPGTFADIPDMHYDFIVCAGVIEHIPHTPKIFLESLNRLIKPGGYLLIETPNNAYLYNRKRAFFGLSYHAPLEYQYISPIPYEGHHREYTCDELIWMLDKLGNSICSVELFNYSLYGSTPLTDSDVEALIFMADNPTYRECILVASKKQESSSHMLYKDVDSVNWSQFYFEAEKFFLSSLDAVKAKVNTTTMDQLFKNSADPSVIKKLSDEIATRDAMLKELQVQAKELQVQANDLQRLCHLTQLEVNKRDLIIQQIFNKPTALILVNTFIRRVLKLMGAGWKD